MPKLMPIHASSMPMYEKLFCDSSEDTNRIYNCSAPQCKTCCGAVVYSGINWLWKKLSPEEKRKELYLKQKAVPDQFLKTGAISQAQYDKSFGDLTEKMGMREYAGEQADSKEQN